MAEESAPGELREAVESLGLFLRITGPDEPPGFAVARHTDAWANQHQAHVVSFLKLLCLTHFASTPTPPSHKRASGFATPPTDQNPAPPPPLRKLLRPGFDWLPRPTKTLMVVYETIEILLRRWRFPCVQGMSFEWGNPPRLMVRDESRPLRIALLGFPLTLEPVERARLEWGHRQLVEMMAEWDRSLAGRRVDAESGVAPKGRAPAASGTVPPENHEARPEAPTAPREKATGDRLTPAAKAIGAALDILREGKAVTLKGACDRAGVDRGHLRERYPEAVKTIRAMGSPDRVPRRGTRDRRTGDIDGMDGPEE